MTGELIWFIFEAVLEGMGAWVVHGRRVVEGLGEPGVVVGAVAA